MTHAPRTDPPLTPTPAPTRATALHLGERGDSLILNLGVVAAGALVVGSGIVHLHLWSTGYRHIPTIGWLFILQGVTAIALGLTVAVVRRIWAMAATFLFVASTIGGFLLSVAVGLFGFRDSWSAPDAGLAFSLEVAALVILAAASAVILTRTRARRLPAS
jgi:hypothetical protein